MVGLWNTIVTSPMLDANIIVKRVKFDQPEHTLSYMSFP